MAIASTSAATGDIWSNVIDDEFVTMFQFAQSSAPVLSGDTLTLTFTFLDGEIAFYSDAGFGLNPASGTINGIDTGDTVVDGMNTSLASFFAGVRDGDYDALNALVWSGADIINGAASNDIIRGFAGSDKLYGFAGNDRLTGDGGADKIYGGTGADALLGGVGNDSLYGQGDADKLFGGAGDDKLYGGTQRDDLAGGSGADTFIWGVNADFAPIVSGQQFSVDFIRDFNRAEGDKIDFSAIDANSTLAGVQDFSFIGKAGFGSGTPGQVHIVATANAYLWRIELNTDGDSGAEFAVMMIGPSPVAGDFLF